MPERASRRGSIPHEKAGQNGRRLVPLACVFEDLFPAGASQAVELRPAPMLRYTPLGSNASLLLQFQQGRVDRAVVDGQLIAAGLLDAPGDALAVQ
jgi:hypothetical protein